ncbi:heparan-alpha-glucosaminide N-acetyltransferase domain-containing protein [Nocardioides sp. CPCC 206347]|uniref:heparan-alpha-glucosaminide N-acetyltransferase domain-containing protein n=1 Tax=Nocardioides sp. CPCC 206347 TaxID=3406463 RepID=UPI003B42B740
MILRPARSAGRLVGVDLARTIALLGMVATHVLDGHTASGGLTTVQWLAGGRASALFAVLAGVSLALITGGTTPQAGRDLGRSAAGIAVRAVLIALIGLALGGLETGLAIILAYYGVLFLLGLPFLGLRALPLAMLAGAWLVVAPVVSHLVRPELPDRLSGSPDFASLGDPGQLLAHLLFTGTYPAVPWLAYLLAGMALGRTDLRGWRTPLRLAGWGAGLAVMATVVSRLCTADPGIRGALFPHRVLTHEQALRVLQDSLHGSPPTGGAWQWLLVVSPHSATPFDLAQTIGSALVVLGLALVLVDVVPRHGKVALALVAGAGAIPLTAYTVHVVTKTEQVWPAEQPDNFGWYAAIVLGLGAAFALSGRRGPLEAIVGWPGRWLRRSD